MFPIRKPSLDIKDNLPSPNKSDTLLSKAIDVKSKCYFKPLDLVPAKVKKGSKFNNRKPYRKLISKSITKDTSYSTENPKILNKNSFTLQTGDFDKLGTVKSYRIVPQIAMELPEQLNSSENKLLNKTKRAGLQKHIV